MWIIDTTHTVPIPSKRRKAHLAAISSTAHHPDKKRAGSRAHPRQHGVLAEVVEAATGQGVQPHEILEVADASSLPGFQELVRLHGLRPHHGPRRTLKNNGATESQNNGVT